MDVVAKFEKRKVLAQYTRLMDLLNTRLDLIEEDPHPHIDCLSREVIRLRFYLERIQKAIHPDPITVMGRHQYPEPISIQDETNNRFAEVERIMLSFQGSKACRPIPPKTEGEDPDHD